MELLNRRKFCKLSLAATGGIFALANSACDSKSVKKDENLYNLADSLLEKWCDGLMGIQIKNGNPKESGALNCPACGFIHWRCGDAIYPLMHMAKARGDSRYLDSAITLYDWMERNVSDPEGSWCNGDWGWRGTTVFGTIALGESLKKYGDILDKKDRERMTKRLLRAANFVMDKFTFKYGSINYPITAAHALTLVGKIFDNPKFLERGKYFAEGTLRNFVTPENNLIFGEGSPADRKTPKGCSPVDLGYNVEESLPAIVEYALLAKDADVLERVAKLMRSHAEFMLPDGAWDNSWGTRNFKWTYWGSRTSDGCQSAYAALADKDPIFYKVAFENLKLLNQCTSDNLLHGGPHYKSHGVAPCSHHTFCHAKILATLLDNRKDAPRNADKLELPREAEYGVKFFKDIQTHLVAKGDFRATVTAYDFEYIMKNGHATGGALSMLWHKDCGAILTASMNEYTMVEKANMQIDDSPDSMPLTPRVELVLDGVKYRNCADLSAAVRTYEENSAIVVEASSKLVDADQKSPKQGDVECIARYVFSKNDVTIKYSCKSKFDNGSLKIILPIIASSADVFETLDSKNALVKKQGCAVKISSDKPLLRIPTAKSRVFNFVPGMEAIPLAIDGGDAEITLSVAAI